jgi:hypothetical protein
MKAHVCNFHQQVAVELCCRYPAVKKKERKKERQTDRQTDISPCTMNKFSSEEVLQLLSTIPNKSNCMKKKKKLRHWMHQLQQCNGEWI